ncbi:hypothetical protein ACR3K2_31870 [Cryptosporidium serpentis]
MKKAARTNYGISCNNYEPDEEDILLWHMNKTMIEPAVNSSTNLNYDKSEIKPIHNISKSKSATIKQKNSVLKPKNTTNIEKFPKETCLSNLDLMSEYNTKSDSMSESLKKLQKYNTMTSPSNTNSVFDRLMDPKLFTGMHKYRFDKDGHGLGKAGREYIYRNDGYTESEERKHEIKPTPLIKRSLTNFGSTKAIPRAKVVWLYRNGDKYDQGTIYYVRPYIKTMNQLLNEISRSIRLIGGPVRMLFDQSLHPIHNVSDIIDGAKYLCTSGEQPAPIEKLERFLSYWIIKS